MTTLGLLWCVPSIRQYVLQYTLLLFYIMYLYCLWKINIQYNTSQNTTLKTGRIMTYLSHFGVTVVASTGMIY